MATIKANDKYRATTRAVFVDGVDTSIAVTAIPTNLPTQITLNWNTDFEAVFTCTGTSGSSSANYTLTGVVKVKGYSGNQAEGSSVNCLNQEEYFNQYSQALDATSLYLVDSGSANAMVVTQSPVPVAYTTGMVLNVKAAATNTTTTTINLNGIGAKTIKKLHNQNLAAGDIEAGQIVTLVYDGTNFQMQSQLATEVSVSTDGWTASSDTWTYASAATFTIAGVDRTAIFTKGTRLKFTQTTAKYAVVVSSSFSTDTTVTIAVNTDYTIANAAITSPYYSYQASPTGYPAWFNFTIGWTGFSANPGTPTYANFSIVGTQIWINFCYSSLGTSNATSFTVTGFPVAIAVNDASAPIWPFVVADNGANYIGAGRITSTTLVLFDQTFDPGGWTNSGSKGIYGFGITYRF